MLKNRPVNKRGASYYLDPSAKETKACVKPFVADETTETRDILA